MNLKPFDLEEAKAHPERLVTRDGRKARILCDDVKDELSVVVALQSNDGLNEDVLCFKKDGRFCYISERNEDLMLLTIKKEGWVRLFKSTYGPPIREILAEGVFNTKQQAESTGSKAFIKAVKIEWEE